MRNTVEWNTFMLKSGSVKPYIRNLSLVYSPVVLSDDKYSFMLKLRRFCLDNEVSFEKKFIMKAVKIAYPDMETWVKKEFSTVAKCLNDGFECEIKTAGCTNLTSDAPDKSSLKRYVIDLLSMTYMTQEDLIKKVIDTEFCKKKHAVYAKKILNKALKEIAYAGYPLVVLLINKIGIKYNYGTRVDLTIVEENEDGTVKPKTNKDIVIEFLKSGRHTKDDIAIELYRKNTDDEKRKVSSLISQIRKMGILQMDIVEGKGIYYVK